MQYVHAAGICEGKETVVICADSVVNTEKWVSYGFEEIFF